MTLDQFNTLKLWHRTHSQERPVERYAWDVVLLLWVAGWVGGPAALLIGAVGWAVRAGCVAVAVVIAGSVVPAGALEPLRYHRSMTQRGVMDRMAEVRSGRSGRALRVAVLGAVR